MKINKILNILMTAALCITVASCAESWKEKTNTEWDEKYVNLVTDIAAGVLHEAYAQIESYPDCYGSNFLDAATDNATTSSYGTATYNLANGYLSATNNSLNSWSDWYNMIQYCNRFIKQCLGDDTRYDKVDDEADAAYKRQYYGEALFLRAYYHYRLLQVFGGRTADGKAMGIPLLTTFYDEDAVKNWRIPRATYAETVNQIVSDLTEAQEYLPTVYTGSSLINGAALIGKPSGLAAEALKSRLLLYAASPAYQDANVIQVNGMGSFEVLDETTYAQGWENAALEADKVIQMPDFGTGFYAIQATDLADHSGTTPSEFIWRKYYSTKTMESRQFPPYYGGTANTIPSQNLVDAYPMANGYPIENVASGYDPSNPYQGRDKRFYLTVYYHGATFGNAGQPINVIEGAKDSYTYNVNGSQTGYYLAKFLSKDEDMLFTLTAANAMHFTPLIRRAEIYLNYAEAANEAWGPKGKGEGCKYTAYEVIKEIREKSGGITDTAYLDEVAAQGKDAFRKLIANERRLEMAFENTRFFDMRRCLMDLTESVRGVRVTVGAAGLEYDTDVVVAKRMYDDVKYYWLPLPADELAKNEYLVNNVGW